MKLKNLFLALLIMGSLSVPTPVKAAEDIVTDVILVASMVFVYWLNFFEMEKNTTDDTPAKIN